MKVGVELVDIQTTVGVKQGDNLGPILFIILINAAAETLNKKWTFAKPDFRWHGMKDKRCKPDLKITPKTNTVGKKFSVKTRTMLTMLLSSFLVEKT